MTNTTDLKSFFILFTLLLLMWTKAASAATSCAGTAPGKQRYLAASREMQFCNGSFWVPMGVNRLAQSPTESCSQPGEQRFNETTLTMEYCDGNNWQRIGCMTDTACNVEELGTQVYDTTQRVMKFCNGNKWVYMASLPNKPCCPVNYVPVPRNTTVGATTDFCVAKYHMKPRRISDGAAVDGKDFGFDAPGHYKADSRPEDLPWGGINFNFARQHCQDLGTNFHLIKNSEWMAVAQSVELTAANWSGNVVGNGFIPTGHSDGFTRCISGSSGMTCWGQAGQDYLAASPDDTQGCFGTNNPDCLNKSSTDYWQKRTFQLANGQIIWDMAGNINSWVDLYGDGSTFSYDSSGNSLSAPIYQLNDPYSLSKYPLITPIIYPPTNANNRRAFLPANPYSNPPPYGYWYDQLGLGTIRWEEDNNVVLFRGGKFDETRMEHMGAPDPDLANRHFKTNAIERRGGIYSVWLWNGNANHSDLGFRCTYAPPYDPDLDTSP